MPMEGTWDLTVRTPIGTMDAVLDLHAREGTLYGTAMGAGEVVELRDVSLDGDRLTWVQSITTPLRLNLAFDVTIDGDSMGGTSKAGRLPSSKVTGRAGRPDVRSPA